MRHPRTLLAASLLLGSSLSAITPAHAGWLKPWWPKIHLPEIDLPCIPHVACPGRYPARKFTPAGKGMASTIPTDVPDSVPHSLIDALGIAYETNPTLTGERAKLRATDENVPTALAGWRPQISVTASSGAQDGHLFTPKVRQEKFGPAPKFTPYYVVDAPNTPYNAHEDSTGVTVTQYLYRSGKTTASTHQAVNSVYAERATLIAQEVQVFSDVVSAYVGV
jgi:outer membrane protein